MPPPTTATLSCLKVEGEEEEERAEDMREYEEKLRRGVKLWATYHSGSLLYDPNALNPKGLQI